MGFIKPAFSLLSTNALILALCYGVNTLFPLIPSQLKLPGTIGTVSLSVLLAFFYISLFRPKDVPKSMYFTAVFLFVGVCFDNATLVDLHMRPNNIFQTNFLNSGDPLNANLWAEVMVHLEGTIPYLLQYIAFYRLFNGLSCRSLELFILGVWAAMSTPYVLPFFSAHPTEFLQKLSVSFGFYALIVFIPYNIKLALQSPRVNNLGKVEQTGKKRQQNPLAHGTGFFSSILFKLSSFVLTLATIALFIYEMGAMRNTEFTGQNLTHAYFQKTNPLLFFQPAKGLLPFGFAHVWNYALVVLPTLLINLIYLPRRTGPLPSWLWDINILSFAIVYVGQGYFLLGPFHPDTPKEYQVDPSNLIFWELNLIPLITCLLNILVLIPFRRSVPGGGVGTGTGDSKKTL